MAKRYRPVDREQEFLLAPNMVEWLEADHLVWFVIEAVGRLDTEAFHRLARLGGVGRRGYDPDMVLTLFVYAMAHAVSSSRQIERLCHTDVAFRVICAQDVPDHTVLARFRKNHQEALTGLLAQSLGLAAELGMVALGTVALDGTKIAGNASRETNRREAHLRKLAQGYLETIAETDHGEDEVFGPDVRGDELPPEVADRSGRRGRIDQALEQIKTRREQADQVSEAHEQRVRACERAVAEGTRGSGGRYPKGTDRVEMARIRWQRERDRAEVRYQDRHQPRGEGEPRRSGRVVPPDEHHRVRKAWAAYQAETETTAEAAAAASRPTDATEGTEAAEGADGAGSKAAGEPDERFTANLTDPESRLLKTRNGWIQGYNCQTATSEDGFIIVARATQDANDVEQLIPTMNDVAAVAQRLAERTGRDDLVVGTLLADAGYDSAANLAAAGPDRLIADGKRHTLARRAAADTADTDTDPPQEPSAREKMNHRLRTTEGHDLYKRRSPLVEAPNAWLKDRRGLRRFARRGLPAAHAELAFASAVTNLLKITTNGITAHQLRAT